MSRQRRLSIASIVLGVVIGCGIAEVATRALSLAPGPQPAHGSFVPDAHLPFKPRPLSRTIGRTDEFAYDYRHNSLGFRDVEHAVLKGQGVRRILGLGDSFTYGVGVSFEETYLYRLETLLNERAGGRPRVEVIKAGIPRYFPETERILLEKYGAQFGPDLIIVGFLPNDVVDTAKGLEAVTVDETGYLMSRQARELGPLGLRVYTHSHVARLLLKRYVDWRIERRYPAREADIFQPNGLHEKDWLRVESEYDKMLDVARSIHARLLIVHVPQRGPWTAQSRYPAARLSAWAARRGAEFLDLLPAMEAAAGAARLYYEKDGHCTPDGHAVIAQELYRFLVDRRLAP